MAGQMFYKRISDGVLVPINQGPPGDKGDTGEVPEAPNDGGAYVRANEGWARGDTVFLPLSGGTLVGDLYGTSAQFASGIDVDGSRIINVATPVSAQDAANKDYVDFGRELQHGSIAQNRTDMSGDAAFTVSVAFDTAFSAVPFVTAGLVTADTSSVEVFLKSKTTTGCSFWLRNLSPNTVTFVGEIQWKAEVLPGSPKIT